MVILSTFNEFCDIICANNRKGKNMGIEKIEIENYKSIKKCNITFKQLNLIIGENS